MNVEVVDSADGHNPVILVEQENPNTGKETVQLNRYQAAKLANQLVEKVDELELTAKKDGERS